MTTRKYSINTSRLRNIIITIKFFYVLLMFSFRVPTTGSNFNNDSLKKKKNCYCRYDTVGKIVYNISKTYVINKYNNNNNSKPVRSD